MADSIINLKLPLSPQDADRLQLGDIVTVSGMVFTGRSRFHIRAIKDNILPLIDYEKINCFLHAGPVMKQTERGWEIVNIEPTSSIRFERYSAQVIRKLNLRTIIGKTTMGPKTAAALADVHGVHLSKIGICGNQISAQVKKVCEVFFLEELGKTEATWVFDVENFGPFFVDIDARGKNYFEGLDRQVQQNMARVSRELGIPAGFKYTEVNAGSD